MEIASKLELIWTEWDFKFIGYQKPNTTSRSRVNWLVLKGIVSGVDIRNTTGSVMRAKPSLTECKNIQFLRYYQVCGTGWFIMDESSVASSQADILRDSMAWIHMEVTF